MKFRMKYSKVMVHSGDWSFWWIGIVVVVCIIVLGGSVTGLGRRGDPCSRDTDCDQLSLIGCDRNTGTCDCPYQLSLYYSLTEGKCLSFVNGDCTYIKSLYLPPINCVENAICIKSRDAEEVNGKCYCKDGYIKTHTNHCVKNQPISSKNSVNGGIEVPKGRSSGQASTRYPEPYHSIPSSTTSTYYLTPKICLIGFLSIFINILYLFPYRRILDVF